LPVAIPVDDHAFIAISFVYLEIIDNGEPLYQLFSAFILRIKSMDTIMDVSFILSFPALSPL